MLQRLRCGLALALLILATTPGRAADVSGQATLVSDYVYRGLSLSHHRPALQGSLDVDLGHGAYGSLWASAMRADGTIASELDLTFGDELELSPSISLDLSATYFAYPGDRQDNYAEGTAALSATQGPVTGKMGVSMAPAQRALRDDQGARHRNIYYFVSADTKLGNTPINLNAALGYERGAFDGVADGGKWDWSVGLAYEIHPACLSLSFVDSNASSPALVASAQLKL